MIRTYAARVTDENIDLITAEAAKWNLTVDLEADVEGGADFGTDIYAILSVNYETHQATFTTMWEEGFNDTWLLMDWHHGPFQVATLKTEKP